MKLFTGNSSVSEGRLMSASVDASLFNPFGSKFAQNPYPVFETLRDRDPVHRTAFGFWVLTRHEHVGAPPARNDAGGPLAHGQDTMGRVMHGRSGMA